MNELTLAGFFGLLLLRISFWVSVACYIFSQAMRGDCSKETINLFLLVSKYAAIIFVAGSTIGIVLGMPKSFQLTAGVLSIIIGFGWLMRSTNSDAKKINERRVYEKTKI